MTAGMANLNRPMVGMVAFVSLARALPVPVERNTLRCESGSEKPAVRLAL